MRRQTAQEELNVYAPNPAHLAEHCRRVAAIANEVAGIMGLPADQRSVLEQACLRHHLPLARLARIFSGPAVSSNSRMAAFRALVAVLCGYHNEPLPDSLDVAPPALAQILKMCELLDEGLEHQAVEACSIDAILAGLKDQAEAGILYSRAADALETLLRSQRDVPIAERLPATIGGAREVVRALAMRKNPDNSDLHDLASADPLLAAEVVRVANSALYSPVSCLRTLPQCINFIGPVVTRRVLLSVAVRPSSTSPELRAIWRHSLDVSAWCESAARHTGLGDPDEAMLAGLFHDIGRIAVHCVLPGKGAYLRLRSSGCPATYLETMLFGEDHGDIGARFLEQWHVSPGQVHAIKLHHRPEQSEGKLASLLYLAEQRSTGVREDLESDVRTRAAYAKSGLKAFQLNDIQLDDQASLISILAA